MKTISGLTIGITLMIVAYILWKPTLAWALTRNPPVTPEGWAPRMRTWKNGIEQ